MRTLPYAIAAVAAAALLACGVVPATGHDTRASGGGFCAERGKTIVENPVARVYGVSREVQGEVSPDLRYSESRYYGCLRATGDRLRLDRRCSTEDVDSLDLDRSSACSESQDHAALNGPFAALSLDRSLDPINGDSKQEIVWARLGAEPVRRRYQLPHGDANTGSLVVRLFVSRHGWVAFSMRKPGRDAVSNIKRIGLIPRPGSRTSETYITLDRGRDVNARSLRPHARAGRISWRTAGRKHSHAWR